MAKKKAEPEKKKMPEAKPVRLDLTPEEHLALRVASAKRGMSMSAFAKTIILQAVKETESKR